MTLESANLRAGGLLTGFENGRLRSEHPAENPASFDARSHIQRLLDLITENDSAQGRPGLSDNGRNTLLSLGQERDPELFFEGLYHWASGQENSDQLGNAGLVYQMLSHRNADGTYAIADVPEGLRRRASGRLDAMEGRGAAGARFEFLSRRFIQESSNPVTLLGMAAGSAAFTTVRSALLARTLSSSRAIFGARALASTGAFLAEVPVFWGTTKGLNEVLHPGQQAWDARSNLRELAGLALTLGALKLSGAATGSFARWAHQPNAAGQVTRLTGLAGVSQRLAPQVGMLGGIMIGHKLEETAGLRRHVDGATFLTDSFVTLAQFNVGGAMSRQLMGERFHAFTQEMDQRASLMESEAFANYRARIRAGLDNRFPGGGQGLALAGAGATAPRSGRSPLQETAVLMSSIDGPAGPRAGRPATTEVALGGEPARATPELPPRTNRRPNGNKTIIVDKLEPELKPHRLLPQLSEQIQDEILQPVSLDRSQISRVNDQHFGDGLAMALDNRIRDVVLNAGTFNPSSGLENLPESFRRALESADELVGVVEYLRRSNSPKVIESFEAAMDPEVFAHYEALKTLLAQYLGPRFGAEVVQPNQAILSIGSGDMMGLLALYRHNIRPGGLSWRSRLFATARDPLQATEINERGTNKSKINLRDIQLNYRYDPPIEAVGPNGYRGLTQEMLQRSVRLQLLNVPSDQLNKILTPEYLRNLPQNAILLEVIGGFIAYENLGRYREGMEEGRSLLPYQLIQRALEANDRSDVSVVSGGGFIPGKHLWHGEQVRMVFAGPEGQAPNSSPAAELVRRTFAGPSGSNDFLEAASTHHQHSTELGKAMKNVTTLLGGFRAVELVAGQMEQGAIDVQGLGGRYETEIRNPLFYGVMRALLRDNDAIVRARNADYRLEVADDYWKCSAISIEEVHKLLLDSARVDVMDRQGLRDFVLNRIVNNPRLAATRNPKRGMVQAIYRRWQKAGTPFELRQLLPMEEDGITPKMTEEGVNSLQPMTQYYNFASHPVERRRLPQELYDGYSAFNPNSPLLLPPRVPERVQNALAGDYAGIDPVRLRRALAGRSEGALNGLDMQLRRYDRFQRLSSQFPERAVQEREITLQLIAAMKEGEPQKVTRSPIIRPPYGNMFVIRMAGDAENANVYRAYIRVDGQRVMDRITQLGTFLRSFPERSRLLVELKVENLDSLEQARERNELERTLRGIAEAYQRVRPDDRLMILLNDTRISAPRETREGPSRAYFDGLRPLANLMRNSQSEGEPFGPSPQSIRNTGQSHGGLLENFLQSNPGWPMLLGYHAGPISQAIKSALTRPERGSFVGIYSDGQMLDAFSVYRGRNNQPMALNHGLMSHLRTAFPGEPQYQDLNSAHFFEGMPLESFMNDYARYAGGRGHPSLQYRLINLRSMPLEEALTGRVEGVNPALLRLFLEAPQNPEQREMFTELAPLYERPFEEVRAETSSIIQRYLQPFHRENASFIDPFPLYQFFEKKGRRALSYLLRNGDPVDDPQ